MSRFRALTALAVVLTLGACSDSQPPSAPSDSEELTFQLDESVAPLAEAETGGDQAGGGEGTTAGRGKRSGPRATAILCVRNRFHVLCADVRRGVMVAAFADAVATRTVNRTRARLILNGVVIRQSGLFGPIFRGDEIFADHFRLGRRVFRGDVICHQFTGATPQICGRF